MRKFFGAVALAAVALIIVSVAAAGTYTTGFDGFTLGSVNGQDGWHSGNAEGWQGLYDNVGVMALRLYADGSLVWAQDYRDAGWPDWVRCNFTRSRPCTDIQRSGVMVDTRTLADGDHTVRVESLDAASNAAAIGPSPNRYAAPVAITMRSKDASSAGLAATSVRQRNTTPLLAQAVTRSAM